MGERSFTLPHDKPKGGVSMDDAGIVELFWQRDEAALSEATSKYERYCFSIAHNILNNPEDAKECVNDTFLAAWNAIPPHRPDVLSTFLGKITRRLSLKKWRDASAGKRGGGSIAASYDELAECIPSDMSADEALDAEELRKLIDAFVDALDDDERRVFLRRYWFFDSIDDISGRYGYGSSKVKMMLKRMRDKLRARLEKEGMWA